MYLKRKSAWSSSRWSQGRGKGQRCLDSARPDNLQSTATCEDYQKMASNHCRKRTHTLHTTTHTHKKTLLSHLKGQMRDDRNVSLRLQQKSLIYTCRSIKCYRWLMNGSRWENMIKAASDGKCCLRCCSSVLFRKILLLKVKRFKTETHASTATALNAARRGAVHTV